MPLPQQPPIPEKKLRLKTNQGEALQACTLLAASERGGEWYLLVQTGKRLRGLKLSEISESEEV